MPTYSHNKKATFNYEILDKFEGGLDLLGIEVKSVKKGQANLEGSYVVIRGGEVFLIGASIPPYQMNNTPDSYDPLRVRKILITKKEITRLSKSEKGLTLIPISLYNKGNLIKLQFAVAKGKKKSDKRETIKTREAKVEMERTLKSKR
ncbi:MAG: SsrA-binding protein [Candidatus Paceibacteria bacterium]|jgi:SsrA-binding protein